jgi:hypothetical protein
MMHPRLDFDSQALEAIAVRGTILAAVLLLGSASFAWAQGTASGTANQPAGATTTAPSTSGGGNQVSPAGESPYDAQADSLLKNLTARQFDARLPNAGLLDWFSGQIGKRGQIDWTTAECGDEGSESDSTQGTDTSGSSGGSSGSGSSNGGASAGNNDVTLCSEGQALFYGADGKPSLDRYVVLQIWVGTKSTGVNQDPGHYGSDAMSIFVFDGDTTRTLTRLGDLPAVLATMN